MKINFLRYLVVSLSMLALNMNFATASNSNQPTVRLSGHIPSKAVANANFVEPLAAATSVPLTFVLPLRNQHLLEELLQRIYNPADENYGKYLTSDEFTEMFAPTQEDYDKVIAYAKSAGMNVVNTHPNRTLLNVSGVAQTIQSAFNVNLNVYQANNRKFHAPDKEPEVPAHIASVINGIVGLDNSAVWRTHNRRGEISEEVMHASSPSAFPSGPNGGFAPKDIKIAYNLNGISTNGTGQSVALFELGSYRASDINAYTNYFGLPSPNLTNVVVDGGTSTVIDEVTLDIELVLALAPASHIYVYEGPNSGQGVIDTYNRIATDNLAKQVSSSWGLGEDQAGSQSIQAENAIFQQMAAQGQTIYVSAGDNGAYDDYPSTTPVVDDPAAQPYVCGVGGTSLSVNANTGAYVSETVWNDGVGNGAGGGGVSSVWSIPSWQTNVSTTYSKTNRNVPDISLNSDQYKSYAIYANGGWTLYGGTSCAAPLWAAFTALVNQQRQAVQMSPLGFANPTLYALGKSQATATDYHDITTGNNYVYQAGPGYDNATGWGSYNGANLFASLTNSAPTAVSVNITSPSNGATVSGIINVTATATASSGIAHVDFYVDSTLKTSDTTSPYSMSLDTTTLTNGQHTLKAIAYDNSSNSAQSVVQITVQNVTPVSGVYINAGGGQVSDICNTQITWQADQYFSGGSTATFGNLPTFMGIYISERVGNFSYIFPVTNGNHTVTLQFAETYWHATGQRLFNVNINGNQVLTHLDLYAQAGYGNPLHFTFPVNVTNNTIKIDFISVVDHAKVSGISIN